MGNVLNAAMLDSAHGISMPNVGQQIGDALTGVWKDYTGISANEANIDYMKDYNDQVFKRADTQYQRTVADLRAAGLSSQLAAGASPTFAGSSQAPQRTVGNESEAIAKLIGMVTSIKATNASAQLASAQADKARSEAALNDAKLPWIDKLNDVQYMTAMANKDYTIAMTRLKMLEGDNYTSKIDAEIKKALSEVNKNDKLVKLYDEQIKLTGAQTELAGSQKGLVEGQTALVDAQEGKTQSERKEINQRIENLKQQEKNLKQEFENIVFQGTKLTFESKLVEQQALTAAWNLFKSQVWNLRTNDTQSKFTIFGSGVSNSESLIDSIIPEKSVPQEFTDLVDSWYK